MPSNYWTPSRTARLLNLRARGMSAARIAEVLGGGITRSAVSSKLHRLGAAGPSGQRRVLHVVPRGGDEESEQDRRLRAAASNTVRRSAAAGSGGRRLRKQQIRAVPPRGQVRKLRVVKSTPSSRGRRVDVGPFERYNVDAETLAEIMPLTLMMIDDHCDIWYANQLARQMFSIEAEGVAATAAVGDPDFRTGVEDAIKNRHVCDVQFPKQWIEGRHFQAKICPLATQGAAVFIREVGAVS